MNSPLLMDWTALLSGISRLQPPEFGNCMDADDFKALHDHMVDVATTVDRYFAACGVLARGHHYDIDTGLFATPCMSSLDGNALFELNCAAEHLAESERDDMEFASRPLRERARALEAT